MKKTLISTLLLLAGLAVMAQPQLRKDNIDEVMQAMTIEEKAAPRPCFPTVLRVYASTPRGGPVSPWTTCPQTCCIMNNVR